MKNICNGLIPDTLGLIFVYLSSIVPPVDCQKRNT